MASRDKVDVDMFHKSIQYALEKLGKSKSGFKRTVVSKFERKRRVGSGNELVDYSRAPCLGADQKARGLWERDWTALGATISGMRLRCRLRSETEWAEFGSFLCYFKMLCSKWLLPELSFSDSWTRGTEAPGTRLGTYRIGFIHDSRHFCFYIIMQIRHVIS